MANLFFEAWEGMTKEQAVTAAYADGISTLPMTAAGVGVFGLWGRDPRGSLLRLVVYRGGTANGQAYSGGTIVNEGPKPAVQLKLILDVPNRDTRVYRATGLRPGDVIYGATSAGLHYIGPLEIVQVTGRAVDVMQDWANRLRDDPAYRPTEPFLCPLATPYLALTKNGMAAPRLYDILVGGPTTAVHGLAVHCTAGSGTRDAFGTAINGCVATWNANYDSSKFVAAAHFAISADGVIVQIIPTNRIAWAQGTPGDSNWISVEVENDGTKAMVTAQVDATRRLFGWVCATYPVPRRLAMGTLFAKKNDVKYKKDLDAATTAACEAAGAPTTTQPFEATFARGLSCHLWLDARNSKPCPGLGILGQMAGIAKP